MMRPSRSPLPALLLAIVVLANGCGPSGPEDNSAPGDEGPGGDNDAGGEPARADPAANAESNVYDLGSSDDVRLVEVLDVETGGVTTIADAVDGDRPVLFWFWAPH